MGEFLRILREMMRGQTNIRARLLRLLVISSLLSALVFAGLSFYGITFVRRDIADMGTQLSESGAEYTKQYINKTSKDTLAELAKAEAGYIDRELSLMQHDVQILSEALTWIQLHPENFLPGNVFDLYNGKVPPTAPCILYSPDVRKRGIETVQKEVELTANIKGTLVPMERSYGNESYSATYFGSKYGFLICSFFGCAGIGMPKLPIFLMYSNGMKFLTKISAWKYGCSSSGRSKCFRAFTVWK